MADRIENGLPGVGPPVQFIKVAALKLFLLLENESPNSFKPREMVSGLLHNLTAVDTCLLEFICKRLNHILDDALGHLHMKQDAIG
ncbi:MAG: hypothetical protein V3U81_02180 [Candidatus Binatia bacterium]